MDASPDAVLSLNSDYRITYCNPAAERLYGIAPTELVGLPFGDVISSRRAVAITSVPPPDPLADLGLANGRHVHVSPGGREIAVRVSLLPLHMDQSPPGYVAIISDASECANLNAALEERLAFERLIANLSARFSSLSEAEVDDEIEFWLRRLVEILEVDRSTFAELTPADTFVVTHSYAAAGIQSYPKGPVDRALPWLVRELRAKRVVALPRIPDDLPPDALAERRSMTESGMTSGISVPIEIGHAVVCVLSFGSFRGPRAWPAELVCRLHLAGDVFANAVVRRQAKQRLEQKQNELAHVGRVAAMGELASVMAHELDQPLTAVVSNAQAIRYLLESDKPDVAEIDEALKDVIDGAMRVSEIVRRERRLLRKSDTTFAPVDVNELIREIEIFIRAEARQDGTKVSLDLLPGLPTVMADRVQLQQVVLNLGRNAFQAMREQSRQTRHLRVRSASRSGEVVLTFADGGPGVDDAHLQRMFEPFYTTKANGLGVGLSISKSIVEAHHGRIWASRNSTAGGGLTMHVAIPHAHGGNRRTDST